MFVSQFEQSMIERSIKYGYLGRSKIWVDCSEKLSGQLRRRDVELLLPLDGMVRLLSRVLLWYLMYATV